MVKVSVNFRKDSFESIEKLVLKWCPTASIENFKFLLGGYSGTNYLIVGKFENKLEDSAEVLGVLKICNGYEMKDVENQAEIMAYLHQQRFSKSCFARKLAEGQGYGLETPDGQPALFLSFIPGVPGDVLVQSGQISTTFMTKSLGENLASLHNVEVMDQDRFLAYRDGGCCNIGEHISGSIAAKYKFQTDSYIREHPFLQFYFERLPLLQRDMAAAGLPTGIIHGDPFLDNVLVDQFTGEFKYE